MARTFSRPALRARGKAFWAGLLRASGLFYLAKKLVQRQGPIVLTFHRVLNDSELQQTASLPGMIVRGNTFSSFLKYASEACEFADLAREPQWHPGRKLKLGITFDDGWADNATAAYPIARQYQAPIVIFIVPEKTGTTLPFWPERAATALDRSTSVTGPQHQMANTERAIEELKDLPANERELRIAQMTASPEAIESSAAVDRTMTWEQIAELRAGGVTFGSHTRSHEILTAIPVAQAKHEIASSRDLIEKTLRVPCSLFSYPNGDCSEAVRDMVAAAGYKFAFLNQSVGVWTRDCDPFLIPRVNVCEYHLIDATGTFSPLIFDYAVVWEAAKGLLAHIFKISLQKLQRPQGSEKSWEQADKKQLEKPF
jgi:peptidoglycan/xylan/chitin deacetylase (PgdA/CDA1 family)